MTTEIKAQALGLNLIRLGERDLYALQLPMPPGNHQQEWWQWTNWMELGQIESLLDYLAATA